MDARAARGADAAAAAIKIYIPCCLCSQPIQVADYMAGTTIDCDCGQANIIPDQDALIHYYQQQQYTGQPAQPYNSQIHGVINAELVHTAEEFEIEEKSTVDTWVRSQEPNKTSLGLFIFAILAILVATGVVVYIFSQID